MAKFFVHFKTKAAFTAATLNVDYNNDSIVFIKDSQEIWTHGQFYAIPDSFKTKITNLETAVNALQTVYGFKKVTDGTNTFSASEGKEVLTLKAGDNTKVEVDATTGEVTIGSTLSETSYFPYSDGKDLTTRVTDLESSRLTNVTGADAIEVTGEGTTKAVSLKLNNEGKNVTLSLTADGLSAEVTNVDSLVPVDGIVSTDKVLTLTDKKIGATINLSIDATADTDGKKYIRLTGKNNADLGKIDIAEFVKDGMLSEASFREADHTLVLTFNTDSGKSDPIEVDLSTLVDVYDGSTIKLKSIAIPETDAVEPSATDSVDSAIANLIKKDRELKTAIDELSEEISDAQSENLIEINKGTDGDFVTTTVTAKANNRQSVSVAVKTDVAIADATATIDGLATASAVKAYVADIFSWEEKD